MPTEELITGDTERDLAEKIVKGLTLPSEIRRVEVRSGKDWSGDPALWVVLWVARDLPFTEAKAEMLNKAAEEVQTKLMKEHFSHFPYVTLDQAA